jgi:hypothetical protein
MRVSAGENCVSFKLPLTWYRYESKRANDEPLMDHQRHWHDKAATAIEACTCYRCVKAGC